MKLKAKFYGIHVIIDQENGVVYTEGFFNKCKLEVVGRIFKLVTLFRLFFFEVNTPMKFIVLKDQGGENEN
jgi:hypothetical protein